MFQYRQVLVRLRRGESDREIARGKYMGRRKLAVLREVAQRAGWLDPAAPLPEEQRSLRPWARRGALPPRFRRSKSTAP